MQADPSGTAAVAERLAAKVGDVYDWRRTARAYLAEFEEMLATRTVGVTSR
jgi:hypothetical protein